MYLQVNMVFEVTKEWELGYNSAKSSLFVVASGIKKINVARAFYASKSENLSFNFRRKRISRGFYYINITVVRENDGKCIQICFLFKCLFYGVALEKKVLTISCY